MQMNHYDVAVCGAGIAGVAAALAAARRGKKTVIIEKQLIVGGLATSGLIYIYLPVSGIDGKVVTSGIAEELLKYAPDYGPFDLPEKYTGIPGGDNGNDPERYCCCFSPAGYTLTLERLLRDAGVEVYLETTVTGVKCDKDNRICEAELFCGADHWNIEADCFIDASGGAFLLRMAGEKVFGDGNYVTPWVVEQNEMREKIRTFYFTKDLYMNAPELSEDRFMGEVLTVAEMQEFIRRQYQAIREYYDQVADRRKCYPVHLPAMPQLRKIARIDGMSLIGSGEAGVYREDSVGVAADWRKLAESWETPYGALVPKSIRGALAAGRCISSDGEAWEIFRVIPAAAMTGEAAGVAAAMCCDRNIDPSVLPVKDLQRELLGNGVILHIADGREK